MHALLGHGHTAHQDDAVLQLKAPLTAVSVFHMPQRFRSEVLVMTRYIVDNCPRTRNYTVSATPTHLHFNVENASFALHKKRFTTWSSRYGFKPVEWDWHFGYAYMA